MNKTSRADMHVHSTASELSKLGIQRSLELPECATPPEEVYDLAKRRGMDFVTITDHDTIDGVLQISGRPDVFISEELTVGFRGEPQAVHVLCYGITPEDHEWLQAHNDDVEACAEYLHAGHITAALAHPFYAVAAPLTARHRRRLAQLFPIWETRNGSRAKELNRPAFVYIETHGGTAIGGSDDHAGIDIGRTFTATPAVATPAEFLAHVRAGEADALGDQGSAAKWTHAAMALAIRSLDGGATERPNPAAVLAIVERVMREGDARTGTAQADLGAPDALALLRAWLDEVGVQDGHELLRQLQEGELTHRDLHRRARQIHERKLAAAVNGAVTAVTSVGEPDFRSTATALFDACLPAIPYAAAGAFLHREQKKLVHDSDTPRVAIVADGIATVHGVSRTLEQIRERGVPGVEIEVLGTDPGVDRRLSSVCELDAPFYPGLSMGVPSLSALVGALSDGRYDLVHVTSPGPAGIGALLMARVLELPVIGSYHTELAAYAALRSGEAQLGALAVAGLSAFYSGCRLVLSPSEASDGRVSALGIGPGRIRRWERGVDVSRFGPHHHRPGWLPGGINVLYAGRMSREKGVDLLADAFLAAHARDPRLHLVLAGGGPEEAELRSKLGSAATFLGWLEGSDLPAAYATADAFLFPSSTDTFGQVVLEAQASGLPVVAVGRGGPANLITHGESGLLCEPDAGALADALVSLAGSPLLAQRLRRGGLAAVSGRTWEGSMVQLGDAYRELLAEQAKAATAVG